MELLAPETVKLPGISESNITKDKKKVKKYHILNLQKQYQFIEIFFKDDDQQDSRVLYTFIPNKSPTSEFQDIRVSFTDQNSQPLEIDDRVNFTLVIKYTIIIKMGNSIESKDTMQ